MILATEPTLHFGRIFMEETIEFIERTATSRRAHRAGKGNSKRNITTIIREEKGDILLQPVRL